MPVYSVGVVILYTYTIINSIYDFSGWALFMGVPDITGLFAYAISGAFLESLIFIALLLVLNLILPKKLTAGKFVLHGTILAVTFLGSLLLRYVIGTEAALKFFAVSLLVFVLLGERFGAVRAVFENIADRCVIFLYVYLPFSFISLLIVIIRNVG